MLTLPALQGAWFSAPENGGFNAFATRYRAKYGVDPPRIATLSYDAVSLAAALAHTQGSQRYSDNVLTNRSGFNGADGVFRFQPDGTNERGLSVLEIDNEAATPISPAPHSFAGSPPPSEGGPAGPVERNSVDRDPCAFNLGHSDPISRPVVGQRSLLRAGADASINNFAQHDQIACSGLWRTPPICAPTQNRPARGRAARRCCQWSIRR